MREDFCLSLYTKWKEAIGFSKQSTSGKNVPKFESKELNKTVVLGLLQLGALKQAKTTSNLSK